VNHTYLTTGNYQIQIIITNTNSVADTLTGQIYTITNTCSALEGLVWMDNNADCIYNTGEQYMTGYAMKVTNTTSSAVVYGAIDGNGEYHIEVPDGYTYTIEIAYLPGGLTVVCPGTGIVTQAVSGMGTYTHNFGYDCSTTANTDFEVYGWSNFFRPGHIRNLSVSANTDNFCMAYPATVTLNLHPLLTCVYN
jgi:PKD repeat protein